MRKCNSLRERRSCDACVQWQQRRHRARVGCQNCRLRQRFQARARSSPGVCTFSSKFRIKSFGTFRNVFSAGLCPVKSQRCPSAASYPPRSRTFWVLATPSLSPRAPTPYSAFRSRASSKKRACARAAAAHLPAFDRVFLLRCWSCSMPRRVFLLYRFFCVVTALLSYTVPTEGGCIVDACLSRMGQWLYAAPSP